MYCELWCEFKITNQLYYYYTLQTVQIDCLINTTIQSSAIDVQVVDQHMPYLSVNPLLFIRKQKPCTTYISIFPQCQHPKCQCLIPKRHVLQSHVLNKNIWMEKRTVLNSYSRNIRTPGYWSLHHRVFLLFSITLDGAVPPPLSCDMDTTTETPRSHRNEHSQWFYLVYRATVQVGCWCVGYCSYSDRVESRLIDSTVNSRCWCLLELSAW